VAEKQFVHYAAATLAVTKAFNSVRKKSWNFYTPPVFSTPAGGNHVGIPWRCEWLG